MFGAFFALCQISMLTGETAVQIHDMGGLLETRLICQELGER
jgi:hypothetical protein